MQNLKKYKNKIDLVCGGIPCQSFSSIGKRKGLDDERGMLIYDFIRCVKVVKPKMYLIENVEGLLNLNKGETFKIIINELEKLDYNIKYKVLNAINFKVPQKRKRLFIVGFKNSMKFKFPKPFDDIITLKEALKNVPNSEGIEYNEKKKELFSLLNEGECWINLPKKLQKEYLGKSYSSGGGKRGILKRLSWDEPCLTLLTSPSQKQTERCHPSKIRPLRTREYARIQTFPDDFIFSGSVSSIYKQIGNAVPCKLAYYIGKQIIKCLAKNNIL